MLRERKWPTKFCWEETKQSGCYYMKTLPLGKESFPWRFEVDSGEGYNAATILFYLSIPSAGLCKCKPSQRNSPKGSSWGTSSPQRPSLIILIESWVYNNSYNKYCVCICLYVQVYSHHINTCMYTHAHMA